MTIATLLLIIALILFIVEAVAGNRTSFNLTAAGLAFLTASMLAGGLALS